MKNILMPTDFSENAWNAIAYALQLLKNIPCNFYLLHVNKLGNLVLDETPFVSTQNIIESQYTLPVKRNLRKVLKRIHTQFPRNKRHKFYTIAEFDFFIKSIREHVIEKKIDFIVMGTKGASGLIEHTIGSNAGDVITKVKCSTLVVPEDAKFTNIKEIAFPTDFALSYNIKTLQPILDILSWKKSSISVVHINGDGDKLNSNQLKNKDLLADFFDEFECNFYFLTNKKVEVAVQCFVESRDIDLMVMVAKNLNYFQQILFHSRVEKISYHTKIPFLVLHE